MKRVVVVVVFVVVFVVVCSMLYLLVLESLWTSLNIHILNK